MGRLSEAKVSARRAAEELLESVRRRALEAARATSIAKVLCRAHASTRALENGIFLSVFGSRGGEICINLLLCILPSFTLTRN